MLSHKLLETSAHKDKKKKKKKEEYSTLRERRVDFVIQRYENFMLGKKLKSKKFCTY